MFSSNPLRSSLNYLRPFFRVEKKQEFRKAHQFGRQNRRLERRMRISNPFEAMIDGKPPPPVFTVPRLKALMNGYQDVRNKNSSYIEDLISDEERTKFAEVQMEIAHYEVSFLKVN